MKLENQMNEGGKKTCTVWSLVITHGCLTSFPFQSAGLYPLSAATVLLGGQNYALKKKKINKCVWMSGVNCNPYWVMIQFGYICCEVTRSEQARRGRGGEGEVACWRRARWGGGEKESWVAARGSINHRSCWSILTLQSHWASMVNVLSCILRGSMRERAWLNTHLL